MLEKKHMILIAEDSDEDFFTLNRALKKAGLANDIYRCIDGEDILDYLYNRGKYGDKKMYSLPNMILLDLNMPKKDGKEVLEVIKKDSKLCNIPIIVLTTSIDEHDIAKCYAMGANSYIQKPVNFERFMEMVKQLKNYWFEIVILPKNEN